MASIDYEVRNELSDVIEDLTTSGETQLDPVLIKKVKNICKKSDEYVKHAYHMVFSQLRKHHAQIRLSSVLIMDELFTRSHIFRELLLDNFQQFMELVVETNPQEEPLPPPENVAQILKRKSMEFIQKWHGKFGSHYKRLDLGFNFLQRCKKVDFQNMTARTLAERQAQEGREIRRHNAWMKRLKKVQNEIKEMQNEMEKCLVEMENCLRLLLPHPDNFCDFSSSDIFDEKENGGSVPEKTREKYCSITTTSKTDTSSGDTQKEVICSNQNSSKFVDTNPEITTDRDMNNEEISNKGAFNGSKFEGSEDDIITTTDSGSTVKIKMVEEEKINCNANLESGQSVAGLEGEAEESSSGEEEEDLPSSKSESEERTALLADHGLALPSYQLNISINLASPSVIENEDNADILDNLREMHQQVDRKYIPMVSRWLKVLSKGDSEQNLVKKIIKLKTSLESTCDKCSDLKIDLSPRKRACLKGKAGDAKNDDDEEEEEEEEFEDVPEKEGFEEHVPAHLRAEYGLEPEPHQQSVQEMAVMSGVKRTCPDWLPACEEDGNNDPTSFATAVSKYQAKVQKIHHTRKLPSQHQMQGNPNTNSSKATSSAQGSSTSSHATDTTDEKRKQLLEKAPFVPFGMDLKYWDKPMETPLAVKYTSLEKFWLPKEYENEEHVPEDTKQALKTRTMKFIGDFQPVRWTCRAPLANGKLCPRKDRYKCPFHGRVIARNEDGSPANPAEVSEEAGNSNSEKDESEWRAIQHDIEASLGLGDGRRKKGGFVKKDGKTSSKTKSRYARLVNLKKATDTPRKRLESKVLSKSALKKVAQEMDSIAAKRFDDKFGNNFNYALH